MTAVDDKEVPPKPETASDGEEEEEETPTNGAAGGLSFLQSFTTGSSASQN
jgi:hypothetical protein